MYPVFNDGVDEVLLMPASRTLLQYIAKMKGIRKSFAAILFNLPVFTQLSHPVAVCQGACCSSLTSSCKYALFSFLKGREEDQTDKNN
jgi:hypothetical protein